MKIGNMDKIDLKQIDDLLFKIQSGVDMIKSIDGKPTAKTKRLQNEIAQLLVDVTAELNEMSFSFEKI